MAPGAALGAALAALAHLLQVVVAVEWSARSTGGFPSTAPWLASLALVLIALAMGAQRAARPAARAATRSATTPDREAAHAPPAGARPGPATRGGARADRRRSRGEAAGARGMLVGVAWALAGAAPIAAVAEIWSAYYYLFALCGAALALGAWLAQRPRGWALAAVTVLAWNSARSGALPAIALVNDPWTSCSHINRHYLERGTRAVERYLSHLRAARPTLPKHSTLFFSGITGSVAFQTADGPLVRWAYRDTSLRSYYLTAFDRVKARRGPLFFFQVRNDSLGERTSERDLYYSMALGAMLGDRPEAAIELLGVERERHDSPQARYWLAWATLALGERDRSLELLRDAGFRAHAGPAPEIQEALRVVGSGDTLRAMQIARRGVASHALDPGAHALYADLVITLRADPGAAVVESYAARLLAPEWSDAWGRWAQVQAEQGRILEAAASLKRYFELAGTKGARDVELRNLERWMRERYPGAARILGPERRAP
jgi:hypothetical protein